MFDAREFVKDYGIAHVEEGHKHSRYGWLQIPCPFCTGNPGYHLGFNFEHNIWNCWRCGFHPTLKIIHHFNNSHSWQDSKKILRHYDSDEAYTAGTRNTNKATKVKYPASTGPLKNAHKNYLIKRKFNPKKIQRKWNLLGTTQIGSYKYRIIAPIYYNGVLVSYQGRDITDKHQLKYKACAGSNEIIDHKHILYGYDQAEGSSCILVEGITDVWRLGYGSVASFGIKTKPNQLTLLAEKFKTVYIMFDDDPQAVENAEDIGNELSLMGLDCYICQIDGDPGDLSQKEADKIRKKLIG